MEDETSVRKLVELIFSQKFEKFEEITAVDSSIPTCLLTNGFLGKLEDVLKANLFLLLRELENHIKAYDGIMFSSCKRYVQCTIIACLTEAAYHENVFEIFVSVCALLRFLNVSIFKIFGKDFRDLNTDVFMVVYDDIMKSKFCEKGGFTQLANFIHGHKYLSLKPKYTASTDAASRYIIMTDFKAERELKRLAFRTSDKLKTIKDRNISLAEKVLSTTSFEFPTLSNNPDLIKDMNSSGKEENVEKNGKEKIMKAATGSIDSNETSQGCSSSNSDSRTDHIVNLPENMPPLGKTIKRVVADYCARFPGNEDLIHRYSEGRWKDVDFD